MLPFFFIERSTSIQHSSGFTHLTACTHMDNLMHKYSPANAHACTLKEANCNTYTQPPTHLPNVSAGSWLKCRAVCMAASCRRLSPYFTAAPGGDKEHKGARLPRRGEQRGGVHRASLSHHGPPACRSNPGPPNFKPLPKFEEF